MVERPVIPRTVPSSERLPRLKIQEGAPLRSDRPQTGRARARYWYDTPACCTGCGKAGNVERHHIDGNPTNNDQSNIALLCRRCHMVADGRIGGALRRDVCKNGHRRTAENTYVSPSGQRSCLVCKTARKQRK